MWLDLRYERRTVRSTRLTALLLAWCCVLFFSRIDTNSQKVGLRPSWTQYFFVASNVHRHLHPCSLVKILCACQALAIDTQPHAQNAVLVESTEGLPQQGHAQAQLAPWSAHRYLLDPPAPGLAYTAKYRSRDLLPVLRQEPQRWIKIFAHHVSSPVLEIP